jgi:CBS domain-containing protein/sporulation protein YlmC with PRC-barrel domain
MVLFSEMFVSQLLGKPVIDRFEERIGKVTDILVASGQTFPRVSGLLVELDGSGQKKVILIGDVDMVGRQFVSTRTVKERVPFGQLMQDDILLCRDILDTQIVDIQGARVVRVNDIKLAKAEEEIRLIAVDIGISGIFRRLGFEGVWMAFQKILRRSTKPSLIGWNFIEFLKTEVQGGKLTIPHKRVGELHPSDIASIISDVHSTEKMEIFAGLPDKTAAEALHELAPKIQAFLLTTVDTKKALGILNRMPVDEAADVIGDLPEEKAEGLLRLLRTKKADEIRKLLKHHDETAGGLMTTEFITFPQNLTVEDTINKLREQAPNAETIYYLYVIDQEGRLVGALSLRRLIVSRPSTIISEIMIKDMITVQPEANQKNVADVISKYNLLAVPVVNPEGKLLGIVTVDDVMDFILPPIARRKRQMLG